MMAKNQNQFEQPNQKKQRNICKISTDQKQAAKKTEKLALT